ncbi:MAG TPA: hypothetical protein VGG71_15950 [Chitinophagaceae bacterium]|jgi:hypothetical protein
MADFKRKTFLLSSGKQIKFFGNSMAIAKNLQIGEGYAPNIFSCLEGYPEGKVASSVSNPYKLTADEIYDMADYNIQLWMNLKANVRKFGPDDPRIFIGESNSYQTSSGNEDSSIPKSKKSRQED